MKISFVNVGPTKALTVTFLTPIFGVGWGALFLDEPFVRGTLVGGAIILTGTALVTGLRLPMIGRAALGGADAR